MKPDDLPLLPFEEYMYLDDRETYPMACFIRLRFSGKLDAALAEKAFEQATSRHPLLRSVVVKRGRERYYWTKTDVKPRFHVFETEETERLPHVARIVLSEEPGVRLHFIVRQLPDRVVTELMFQEHHAACDGIGLLQLIDDFLRFYAVETGVADASVLPPPDPATLRRRAVRCRQRSWIGSFLGFIPSWIVGIGAVVRSYIVTPTSLVPMDMERFHKTLPESFPAILSFTLDVDETKKLQAAAKSEGVTLNDWLIRDTFLALGRFRDKHFPKHAERNIRLTVPVNLRTDSSGQHHVANNVGMLFVDRKLRGTETPEQLLHGIQREMKSNKKFDVGGKFVGTIRLSKLVPGLLPAAVHRKRRVWTTCIFSNVGKLFADSPFRQSDGRIKLGDSTLLQVDAVPPIRAWTAVAFGVATYAGSMTVALHYDTQTMSPEQGGELLEMLRRQILQRPQD